MGWVKMVGGVDCINFLVIKYSFFVFKLIITMYLLMILSASPEIAAI
jgi:hypothetical protein